MTTPVRERMQTDFVELCKSAERYGVPVRYPMAIFSDSLARGDLYEATRMHDDLAKALKDAREERSIVRSAQIKRASEIGLALLLAAGLAYGFFTA